MKKFDRKTIITLVVFVLIVLGIVIYMRTRKQKAIEDEVFGKGKPEDEVDEGISPPDRVLVGVAKPVDAKVIQYNEVADKFGRRKGHLLMRLDRIVPSVAGKTIKIDGSSGNYNKCFYVIKQWDSPKNSLLRVAYPIQRVTNTWTENNLIIKADITSKGNVTLFAKCRIGATRR